MSIERVHRVAVIGCLLLIGCPKKEAVETLEFQPPIDVPAVVAQGQCDCLLQFPVLPGQESPELESCMVGLFTTHGATVPTEDMVVYEWTPPQPPDALEGTTLPTVSVPRVFETDVEMNRYAEVSYECTKEVMTLAYRFSRLVWSESSCEEQCVDMPENTQRLCTTICVASTTPPTE